MALAEHAKTSMPHAVDADAERVAGIEDPNIHFVVSVLEVAAVDTMSLARVRFATAPLLRH